MLETDTSTQLPTSFLVNASFEFLLPPHATVKKRHFLRHLCIKCTILPRQARDKHRESTQKRWRFLRACEKQRSDWSATGAHTLAKHKRTCRVLRICMLASLVFAKTSSGQTREELKADCGSGSLAGAALPLRRFKSARVSSD